MTRELSRHRIGVAHISGLYQRDVVFVSGRTEGSRQSGEASITPVSLCVRSCRVKSVLTAYAGGDGYEDFIVSAQHKVMSSSRVSVSTPPHSWESSK